MADIFTVEMTDVPPAEDTESGKMLLTNITIIDFNLSIPEAGSSVCNFCGQRGGSA